MSVRSFVVVFGVFLFAGVGCILPSPPACLDDSHGRADGEADAEACDPLLTSFQDGPGRCDPGEEEHAGYDAAYFQGYCDVHLEKLDADGVGCGAEGEDACAEAEAAGA